MRGSSVIVPLLPTFGYASDDRPLPRQLRAVGDEEDAGDEDDDGPLEPWHMFARRQDVRWWFRRNAGSTKCLPGLYPVFIPHSGRGGWVRLLRLITANKLQDRFFDASSGARSVFGRWAACVNDAIEEPCQRHRRLTSVSFAACRKRPRVRQPLLTSNT